jgi:hypothetical protein
MLFPSRVLFEDALQRSRLLCSLKKIAELPVYDLPITFITPNLQGQPIPLLDVVRRTHPDLSRSRQELVQQSHFKYLDSSEKPASRQNRRRQNPIRDR